MTRRISWIALFLVLVVAAGFWWLLSDAPPPPRDDWDAMQDAFSGRADPARAPAPPAAPSRPARETRVDVDLPEALPPGGPFAVQEEAPRPEPGDPAFDYRLWMHVEDLTARGDLDAAALGARLLESPVPMDRITGAALLAALGALDNETLVRLAADPEAMVPLNVLGWLRDTGEAASADALVAALRAEDPERLDLLRYASDPDLSPAARRALVQSATQTARGEEAVAGDVMRVAANQDQPLEVRVKAAYALRDAMDPRALQESLERLRVGTAPVGKASGQDGAEDPEPASSPDPAWRQILPRLMKNLDLPPELAAAAQGVTVYDIQEWTAAGPVGLRLLETATRIEDVLARSDVPVQPGATDALTDYLLALGNGEPLPPPDLVTLRRIQSRIPALYEREAAGDGANFVEDAPPGF